MKKLNLLFLTFLAAIPLKAQEWTVFDNPNTNENPVLFELYDQDICLDFECETILSEEQVHKTPAQFLRDGLIITTYITKEAVWKVVRRFDTKEIKMVYRRTPDKVIVKYTKFKSDESSRTNQGG